MYFWIIKCVCFESIIFTINLDAMLSSKVFITFDFVFLLIVLLTLIKKFISFQNK